MIWPDLVSSDDECLCSLAHHQLESSQALNVQAMNSLYLLALLIISASASSKYRITSSPSLDDAYDDDDYTGDEYAGDDDLQVKPNYQQVPKEVPSLEETVAYDDGEEELDQAGKPLGELDGQPEIQCYQCNSRLDGAACLKSKAIVQAGKQFLKRCPPLKKVLKKKKDGGGGGMVESVAAVGCWKLSQQVDYSQGPDMPAHFRVIRGCAYLGQEEASCASRAGYGTSTTQCFCSTSRCNAGAPMSQLSSIGVLIVVMASGLLLSHLFLST